MNKNLILSTALLLSAYFTTNAQIRLQSTGVNSVTSTVGTGTNNLVFGTGLVTSASSNNVIAGTGGSGGTGISGTNNVLLGMGAGHKVTSGMHNVCASNNAGANLTTGLGNNFIGYFSAAYLTTGNGNTVLGSWAATSQQFNGSGNVVIGSSAATTLTTGNNNTAVGASSSIGGAATNATAIGFSASAPNSNTMILGGTGANAVSVGIGTSAPYAKLTVIGDVVVGDGSLTINKPTGYSMYVQKGILTEKVKVAVVNSTNWADYVFENHYKLMPLSEVESFVKKEKHLPGVPSASELIKSGLDLGEMQAKQMEKIEELTLYMIELKKDVEKLKTENKDLKAKLAKN
jgi:trimeric autotransporter adhesin